MLIASSGLLLSAHLAEVTWSSYRAASDGGFGSGLDGDMWLALRGII